MECVLLGSGGMMPMPARFLTALAVRVFGNLYLFDAGEGTQINLKRAKLGIKTLRFIAVSHLHGDHCLGLPGLLMMRAQLPDPEPLTIVGPPGIERFISQTRELLRFFVNYPIRFVEWTEAVPPIAYQDERVQLSWAPLKHTAFCLGFRLAEHPRPGEFRVADAERLGVPRGPAWGSLQRGEPVMLPDGTRIDPEQVLGPARPGRQVCFAVDTRPTKSLYHLCQEADIAFLDGMFHPEEEAEAEARMHMTVDDAARVAQRAGVRRAVLVHISPRYRPEDENRLAEAARQRHPEAEIGADLKTYFVSLRE
jgi:ribonuclease Z